LRPYIPGKSLDRRHTQRLLLTLCAILAFNAPADYLELPCPEEGELASKTLQRIENEWPMRGSGDPVTQYVHNLGTRLVRTAHDGQRVTWRFMVLRNLEPNAFSIGDGLIFITEGAMNLAQTESELAAIIAHEIGHELGGHFCRQSSSLFLANLLDVFSSKTPEQVEHGSITQEIDPAKEQQADRIAIQLLDQTGFNPYAILEISRRLANSRAGHFQDSNRLKSLEQTLKSLNPLPIANSEAFLSIKRAMSAE